MCGLDTKAECIPRAEDGKSAVAASHTRIEGPKDTVHAAPFNLDGLHLAIQFWRQSFIHYVIPPSPTPDASRSITDGSRSHGIDSDKS